VQMNDTKKLKLEGSLFTPETETSCRGGGTPLVIYCHCNSGSRRDSEEALHLLMPAGIRVFSLDFAVGTKCLLGCSCCAPRTHRAEDNTAPRILLAESESVFAPGGTLPLQ